MNDDFVWVERDTSSSVHLVEKGHAIGAVAEQGAAAVTTVGTPPIKPTGSKDTTKKDGAAGAPKSVIKAGVGRKGNSGALEKLTQVGFTNDRDTRDDAITPGTRREER